MKKYFLITFCLLISKVSQAHNFGFNFATGLPYLTSYGLNYVHSSKMFSAELSYNALNLSVATTTSSVSVGITKPELSLKWHPFSGAFYLGVGFGQQTLTTKESNTVLGQAIDASITVKSTTTTPEVGWMWGMDDAGFFGGIDFGYQNPSGAQSTTTTNASAAVQADPGYQTMITDTNDQARKWGLVGFTTMTFLRLGYLF